jgi:hypothetical protein
MRAPSTGTEAATREAAILVEAGLDVAAFGRLGKLAEGTRRPYGVPLAAWDVREAAADAIELAFTLPPGAYATLVVKRLFAWTLEPRARKERPAARPVRPPRPPEPTQEERIAERRRTGFLAAKRARRAARRGAGTEPAR